MREVRLNDHQIDALWRDAEHFGSGRVPCARRWGAALPERPNGNKLSFQYRFIRGMSVDTADLKEAKALLDELQQRKAIGKLGKSDGL
jgi:hypothetical protein